MEGNKEGNGIGLELAMGRDGNLHQPYWVILVMVDSFPRSIIVLNRKLLEHLKLN